ncbi:hypothetical protein NL676_009556 [Syzygium grande]|nr:hypothetical protein NL676_009556 [Syzygium grande]
MEKALEWLDLKGDGEAVDGGALRSQFSMSECSWRASHACPGVHASTPAQSELETLHSCPRFTFGVCNSEAFFYESPGQLHSLPEK